MRGRRDRQGIMSTSCRPTNLVSCHHAKDPCKKPIIDCVKESSFTTHRVHTYILARAPDPPLALDRRRRLRAHEFVLYYTEVVPPRRFAEALVARWGRESHVTVKMGEALQIAPSAFRAQPLRAARSSYNIMTLLSLVEPLQASRVAVTTLNVWDVRTDITTGDRKRTSF